MLRKNEQQVIPVETLRREFDYDPDTGILRRKGSEFSLASGDKDRVIIANGVRAAALRIAWAMGHGEWPAGRRVRPINGDANDRRLVNLKIRDDDLYDEHGKISRAVRYKWGLKAHYGLTRADYDRMHEAQNGLCAMCHEPERRRERKTERPVLLSVDHDHDTGQVRDLLCDRCNRLLGICDDNASLLLKGVEYLRKHRKSRLRVISVQEK